MGWPVGEVRRRKEERSREGWAVREGWQYWLEGAGRRGWWDM